MRTEKGLTSDQIQKVAETQIRLLEKCSTGFHAQGALQIHLTINPDGTVKEVARVSGKIKDVKWRRGVVDQIKKWLFPATTGGKAVRASITIALA